MSHQDKFWEKFGKKLGGYQPDGYEPSDWAAMEELLQQNPVAGVKPGAAQLGGLAVWKWAGLALLLGLVAYFIGMPLNEPSTLEAVAPDAAKVSSLNSALAEASAADTISSIALKEDAAIAALSASAAPQRGVEAIAASAALGSLRSSPTNTSRLDEAAGKASLGEATQEGEPDFGLVAGQAAVLRAQAQGGMAPGSEAAGQSLSRPQYLAGQGSVGPFARQANLEALPARAFQVEGIAIDSELSALPSSRRSGPAFHKGFILGTHLTITDYQSWQASVLPVVGFYLAYNISDRWSLQAEAHARFVGNYDLERSYSENYTVPTGQSYFYEASSKLYSYTSIDLPLLIQYRLKPRWSLAAGLRHSIILENNGQRGSSVERGNNFSFDNLQSNWARLQLDRNLWPHDWGVLLGASRHFTRGWSLHLRYTQGLRDLSPDNFYGNDAYHLNSDLHFSIRKNF
jgi:hypothetical protein